MNLEMTCRTDLGKNANGTLRLKRFTLIELLMVITVIVILMSLLLPALKKVREKGNEITCLNKLKQAGVAGLMYSQDWNDEMIGIEFTTSYWIHQLAPYYSGHDSYLICYTHYPMGPGTSFTYGLSHFFYRVPGVSRRLCSSGPASERMLLGDGNRTSNTWWMKNLSWGNPFPDCPHSGGNNFVFLDGHVKWLKRVNIPSGGTDNHFWNQTP